MAPVAASVVGSGKPTIPLRAGASGSIPYEVEANRTRLFRFTRPTIRIPHKPTKSSQQIERN